MSLVLSRAIVVRWRRILAVGAGLAGALCAPAEAYRWRRDMVGVMFNAPPVLLQMVDSQGRRIGVDFTRTVEADGYATFGNYFHPSEEFRDISATAYDPDRPVGFMMQDNISNDDPDSPNYGKGQPVTGWDITLMDGGVATYDLVYRGMATGQSWLDLNAMKKLPTGYSQTVEAKTLVLVEPGVERRIRMVVDPQAQTIKAVRVVSATEMESDIGLACRLGLIAPDGICLSLSAKARAIADARARGRVQAARGATKAFLNELKAQGGKHVQEPALTILREEAEALLNPAPPMPKPKKPRLGGARKPAK